MAPDGCQTSGSAAARVHTAAELPNPFNPSTSIQFSITKNEQVKLVMYNMLGQKIRTIVDQEMAAGTFIANWDGRNDAGNQLASGAYFYRLETKSFARTMTMLLIVVFVEVHGCGSVAPAPPLFGEAPFFFPLSLSVLLSTYSPSTRFLNP